MILYADSSALVKRYVQEDGTPALAERMAHAQGIYTSWLARAEILATLARKRRNQELTEEHFQMAKQQFAEDWLSYLAPLALNFDTMAAVVELVSAHPLKASDAVHLSTALWIRETSSLAPELAGQDVEVEFAVADRQLARIAAQCGLAVFNPETSAES